MSTLSVTMTRIEINFVSINQDVRESYKTNKSYITWNPGDQVRRRK